MLARITCGQRTGHFTLFAEDVRHSQSRRWLMLTDPASRLDFKAGSRKRGTPPSTSPRVPATTSPTNDTPHQTQSISQNGASSGSLLPLLQEQGERESLMNGMVDLGGKRSDPEKSANASTDDDFYVPSTLFGGQLHLYHAGYTSRERKRRRFAGLERCSFPNGG